jgi:signal transduction histidine kinase
MPEQPTSERLHRFAHDLRNRLHAMWELAHMTDGQGLSASEREAHLERSYFQAQRAVEDLLDDLGVDRDLRPSGLIPVPIAEVMAEAAKRESFRYARKRQELRTELPPGLAVRADRDMLVQLLAALLSNAGKFSPAGSIVHMAASIDGAEVSLKVADPGTGIAGHDLERVFERFVITGSRSTDGEPQARGTLARARQWAEAMGGSLRAFSEGPGQGSTFVLVLPAVSSPRA